MSIPPKAMRTMRIIALPLARPKIPPEHSLKSHAVFNPNRMLIYYHFDISQGDIVGKEDHSVIKRVVKWASTKSADLWASFGKAPEGSWKASPLNTFSSISSCHVNGLSSCGLMNSVNA